MGQKKKSTFRYSTRSSNAKVETSQDPSSSSSSKSPLLEPPNGDDDSPPKQSDTVSESKIPIQPLQPTEQLVAEELDHPPISNPKRRVASEEPELIGTPPRIKRPRVDGVVMIQRSDPDNNNISKSLPKPPTEDPPQPSKFLKLLLLGPSTAGKKKWVQSFDPQGFQTTSSSSSTSSEEQNDVVSSVSASSSFSIDYYSRDYSFLSSSAVPETVRLQMYNVDGQFDEEPPSMMWGHSLIPSMQHIVLVLDLLAVQDAPETLLRKWKTWLERHIVTKLPTSPSSTNIPMMSLLMVNSKNNLVESRIDPVSLSSWFKLGTTAEKLDRYWPINKWYVMENEENSLDVILQTLIERTWSSSSLGVNTKLPQQPDTLVQEEANLGFAVGNGHSAKVSDN